MLQTTNNAVLSSRIVLLQQVMAPLLTPLVDQHVRCDGTRFSVLYRGISPYCCELSDVPQVIIVLYRPFGA